MLYITVFHVYTWISTLVVAMLFGLCLVISKFYINDFQEGNALKESTSLNFMIIINAMVNQGM